MSIHFPHFPGRGLLQGAVMPQNGSGPPVSQNQLYGVPGNNSVNLTSQLPRIFMPTALPRAGQQVVIIAIPQNAFFIPPTPPVPRWHLIPNSSHNPPLTGIAQQLFEAVSKKKSLQEIKQLLNTRIPLDTQNEKGSTLMHEAAFWGRADIIGELKRRGLKVNVLNTSSQQTPLHEAALRAHTQCVKLLCDLGGNANAKDISGKTPLHYACMLPRDEQIILKLVKAGANANEPDKNGNTPVHEAARNGLWDAMNLLIRKGGNPEQRNHEGKTPKQIKQEKQWGYAPVLPSFVPVQLPKRQHEQSEDNLEASTQLLISGTLKKEEADEPAAVQYVSTAFQLPDPLAELRTSIERENDSIADIKIIQNFINSETNPFLKINWTQTEQPPGLKSAPTTPVQETHHALEEAE
jgi:hypothetical protein